VVRKISTELRPGILDDLGLGESKSGHTSIRRSLLSTTSNAERIGLLPSPLLRANSTATNPRWVASNLPNCRFLSWRRKVLSDKPSFRQNSFCLNPLDSKLRYQPPDLFTASSLSPRNFSISVFCHPHS
jgi:hypothetical protein